MKQARRTIKALGLCALMLGVMAIAAGAAQANGTWGYINGSGVLKFFNAELEPQLKIREIENKTGSLLVVLKNGTHVEFLCTTAAFIEGGKLTPTGGVSLGRVKFSGCKTLIKGVASPPCEPIDGSEKGVILTEKIKGLLELKEVLPVVNFTPDEGTVLAVIEMGEECAIGSAAPVTGNVTMKDCKGLASTHAITHLVEQGPGTSLTVFAQPAKLIGSAIVGLAGAHEGLKWAGLAP